MRFPARISLLFIFLLSLTVVDLFHHRARAQRVRPEGEISCIPARPGMISWWPGEGNARDIRGDNHGTLQNGVGFVNGEVEQAFSFDGIDDFVEVPSAPSLDFQPTDPITVETWVFRTGSSPVLHILGKRDNCGSFDYQMAMDPGNGLHFNSSN